MANLQNTLAYNLLKDANSEETNFNNAVTASERDFRIAVRDAKRDLDKAGEEKELEVEKLTDLLAVKQDLVANSTSASNLLTFAAQADNVAETIARLKKEIATEKANAKAKHSVLEARYNQLFTELPAVEAPVQA